MIDANASPLLSVRGLTKRFPVRRGVLRRVTGAVRAVESVDLDVCAGQCLGLVGESGCGKTTLGRAILRLIEPDAGSIRFDGTDVIELPARALRAFRRHAQVIFQNPYGSLNPRLTAGQTVAEGVRLHRGDRSGPPVRQQVRELLETVGLAPGAERRYPHELSGGQRQRVGIARALSVRPRFIVCDEPVSALDVSVRAQIINLLRRLQGQFDLSYLFISHDLSVVRHVCDTVAVMYLGHIVEHAPADLLFATPRHHYTHALLSAIPVPDPRVRTRRLVLEGDVPSPIAPPPGCPFHPRCPAADAVCREQMPPLVEHAPEHLAACHHPRA